MGYRVRNVDGELRFDSFEALRDAYVQQLVDADDEVLEDGASNWRKAGTLPRLTQARAARPTAFQRESRWYVLALVLLGGLVYFVVRGWDWVTFAIVLLLVAGLLAWYQMSASRRRRR